MAASEQKMHHKARVAIAGLLLATAFSCPSIASEWSGARLKSIWIALNAFADDQPQSDLFHFTIDVKETSEEFEIIFVPDNPALMAGGVTEFGREVHYFVSKDNFKILRKQFAR